MRVPRQDARITARPSGARRSSGAAGRSPRAPRRDAPRARRTRVAPPQRYEPPRTAVRARRTQLTARAAILAAAIVTVSLTLALPFKTWLSQREQIASLRSGNHALADDISRLQQQEKLWHQPSYIESQARKRLHYVLPGQTAYVVVGRAAARHRAAVVKRPADTPWYAQLWDSAQRTGG